MRFRRLMPVLAVSLVVAVASAASALAAKSPEPLYTVSLSGSAHLEETESQNGGTPPYGCKGQSTVTFHYEVGGQITPSLKNVPLLKHGKFRYFVLPAHLGRPTASLVEESNGSWALDPTLPFLPDPSVCLFQPTRTVGQCTFSSAKESFSLFPNPGDGEKFTLAYGGGVVPDCPPVVYPQPGLAIEALTSLRVKSVLALKKGQLARVSATSTRPVTGALSGTTAGTETVTYQLVVKRVS